MAVNLKKSRLSGANPGDFQSMIQHFGVVTVMNVDVYDTATLLAEVATTSLVNSEKAHTFDNIKAQGSDVGNARGILDVCAAATTRAKGYIGRIESLKIANITSESSDKTITGGQSNSPLIKFYNGKTARLEMQDALGHADMLEAFNGAVTEFDTNGSTDVAGVHFGGDVPGSKTLVGDSFFIDQVTGAQVPVKILFYNLVPEPIFNFTQDAEGDATVFDMNGDLMLTNILVANASGSAQSHGVFYSIVDPTV